MHLSGHFCINLRLPTYGGLHAWEFEEKGARAESAGGEGQLVLNRIAPDPQRALAGFGLRICPERRALPHLAEHRTADPGSPYYWCPPFPGYHLYYPEPPATHAGLRLARRRFALPTR